MTPETVQRLDKLFTSMPVLVGGAAPRDDIDLAEQRIGMKFDPDYREFLKRYGGAIVGSLPVLGLRQAEAMGDDTFSVVDVTVQFRLDGWTATNQWIVISIDLAGNPIGLSPSGTVWIADHDVGETRIIAPSFEDFVVQLLDASV